MAPSPDTQTLRRILLLEQSQGFQDHAVIGGMERYVQVSPAPVGGQDAGDSVSWRTAVLELLRDYHALTVSQRREAVEKALTLLSSPAESGLPRQRLRTTDAGVTAGAATPVRSAPQKPTGKRRSPSARPPTGSSPRLTDPVDRLKGVGPANAKRLAVLGVSTIQDLIYHFPRRYDDFAQRKQIKQLALGDQVTVVGVVRSTGLRRTGGRSLFRATLSDETGAIECTWFNQPHLDRSLTTGLQIAVSGQVSEYRGRLVFSSPEWEPVHPDPLNTGRVVPIYPLTQGLYARSLRRLIRDALDLGVPQIVDSLPSETRESAGLIDLQTALRQIHFPDSADEMQRARERLSFDELLMLQLGVLRKRGEWRREPGAAIPVSPEVTDSFLAGLPFALTQAQHRAIADILKDMAQPVPMSRLLQGDVGSGKTVVAVAAMLGAVRAGYQAALMAPTSILAEQHADTITRMLGSMPDVRVALLEGSQSAAEKAAVRDGLARGDVDVIIGTHALIQENVAFDRLGLIIVDEQHRFGVTQRQSLRDKNSALRPHMLAMSATPIPRTLALTIYGDLDVSILDELPPNRQPIVTAVRTQASRGAVYDFVRSQLERGHQAYIICPLVEESEQIDARAAVEEHERLSRDILPQFRLGLLHGRVAAEEKERVMQQFKAGDYDILVSTAVVEVGVDVPNATVMLIEGAERFGLAQLHQFRGRVGRGEARSYCVLLSDAVSEQNQARLQVMAETNDGFVLAEKDLELRGPGDFLGVRQHGLPELKLAQLTDKSTLELARREALSIFERDPELRQEEHLALARQADAFWSTVSRS